MALSSIAERQLQSQGQGWPATMPNLFSFEQAKPKENKFLTRDEVKKAISWIADKKEAIRKLINSGYELEWMNEIQIPQEIPTSQPIDESKEWFIPTIKEAWKQSYDFLGWLMTAPARAASGLTGVIGDVISAPFYSDVELSWIFTWENADKGIWWFFRKTGKNLEKDIVDAYGIDTSSWGYTAGEVVWGIATTLPASVATWWLGLVDKASKVWTLGKIWYGALWGIWETGLYNTAVEWRIWTPQELATWAAFWAVVPGIWAGISWLKSWPLNKFFSSAVWSADNLASKADDLLPNVADDLLAKKASEFKNTVQGRIDWIDIEVPKPSAFEWAKKLVLPSVDPVKKANKALTPSYAGKTNRAIIEWAENAEKNANNLWKMVRKWEINGDLSTLESSARTVVDWLDTIGAKIWKAVSSSTKKVWFSNESVNLLDDAIKWVTAEYSPITPLLEKIKKSSTGIQLPVKDAFELKVILNNEVKKFIKSWDAWTQQYKALIGVTQDLTDRIDNIIYKTKWLSDLKRQYKELKAIADDITRSAQVEARSSPMSLVEQIWFLDAVWNPMWAAKQLFARELKEMNSRWWNWKSLMDYYDSKAIKEFEKSTIKPKNISAPKAPVIKNISNSKVKK